jgi:hypothetical protein
MYFFFVLSFLCATPLGAHPPQIKTVSAVRPQTDKKGHIGVSLCATPLEVPLEEGERDATGAARWKSSQLFLIKKPHPLWSLKGDLTD